MTTNSKDTQYKKTTATPVPISQAEIIKKINKITRRSYKLFDQLIWNSKDYGSTK